jgi:predicted RND superfamily exporter protein
VFATSRDPYSPGSAVPVADPKGLPPAPTSGPGERTRRFVRWTLRHGGRLWAIAALLAIPATIAAANLYRNLSSDIEELLPQNSASVLAMHELRARLPGLSSLGIVIAAPDPSAFPAALRLADDLAARVRQYPSTLVRNVRTGPGPERRFIEQHAAMFVDTADLDEIRARIQARRDWDSRKRLGIAFDEEDKPPPLDFSDLEAKYERKYHVRLLPTSAEPASASERTSRDALVDPPAAGGDQPAPPERYADPKTGLALVLVEGTESSTSAHGAGVLLSRVKHDLRALGGPGNYAPGIRVGFAGNVAVSVEELTALEEDLGTSSVLVVIAVLGVILFYYRWWYALPILFLPLLLATTLAFGLVTLPPFRVDRLSSSTAFLGSIIVGNGINYGVIWLGRYVEARRSRELPPEAALCEAVWGALPGTTVAALGAAAAYASLVLTQFRGFRQFGIIGAIGMLVCWAATYLLSPSLTMAIERRGHAPAPRSARRTRSRVLKLVAGVLRHPRPVVAVVAVLTVASLIELRHLGRSRIESDFSKLRRRDTWTAGEGYWGRKMDSLIGGNLSPTVVLTDAPAQAAAIAARVRADAERPPMARLVASVRALDDVLPRDQPAKQAAVEKLRAQLTPLVRSKLPPDKLASIDRLLASAQPVPMSFDALPPALTAGLRENGGAIGRTVLVFPRLTKQLWQSDGLETFVDRLRTAAATDVPPGGRPGRVAGYLPLAADITASLERDGPRASLLALIFVAALVVIVFRRGERAHATAAAVLATLLVGVTWMVAATLRFGIKINFANFAAFPITFGIGVDYAVNIMARFRQERDAAREWPPGELARDPACSDILRAVGSTGGAVTLCSLTTIIGYSSLLLAKNQALYLFGAVAVAGEICCLTAALVALPAVLLAWPRLAARL